MTNSQLADCLNAAEKAARRAGAVLEDWRSRFSVREKGKADLVTDADEAAQLVISEFLSQRFPEFAFLGEEGEATTQLGSTSSPTWIVDPLDGTTNYVHDLPLYCVSIGLWANRELVLGVVFDPRQNEMFRAANGCGAWLGDKRLHVSETTRLDDALLSVGFPADPKEHHQQLKRWEHFKDHCHGLRRTGSSALNLAYVAAGRFDAFFALGNKIWDVAAGTVLVREAGGLVTRYLDSSFDETGNDLLAANPAVHAAIQNVFIDIQ